MRAEADPFNRDVATKLARVAQRYPEKLPELMDFCRRHVEANAEQLIRVAQEGEGAWMYKLMEHFRGVALKLDEFEHFRDFFITEFEPRLDG